MYRSSLTLAFVVLYSAAGAASDLSSVYVAPGGIYAPSANVYVRPGPAHRPYAEPGYGYRQPSYGWIPHTAHRHRSMATTDRPTPRSRSMSTARPPIPSVTTLPSVTTPGSATPRRNTTMNMRRGRRCPCPTVRGHDASTTMAGRPTAIKARTYNGWSAAIPIAPPRAGLMGFAFALPILRAILDRAIPRARGVRSNVLQPSRVSGHEPAACATRSRRRSPTARQPPAP